MIRIIQHNRFKDERGITLVLVALLLIPLIGIGALVVDLGLLYAARNELQNASDAGALAGARVLYSEDGTSVNNIQAVTDATNAAIANFSHGSAVEVGGNDVQVGHWSFGLGSLPRGFYPSNSTTPPELWNRKTEELDEDPDFINAVQVTTRREETQVGAFFSRIFNIFRESNNQIEGFSLSATAVGYIGFAGSLQPGDVDQPIAICKQSILSNGLYQCNIGRMLNSSNNNATSNTGGWTNFTQPCKTSTPGDMDDLLCKSGNITDIFFDQGIGSTNGVQDNVFRDLETCWKSSADSNGDGIPDTTWELTLPVIDCPSNAVSNCAKLLGAVTVKVVWVQSENPGYDLAPTEMNDIETNINWPSSQDLNIPVEDLKSYFVPANPGDKFPEYPEGTLVGSVFYEENTDKNKDKENKGMVRWASFVRRFNLRNVGSGNSAPFATFAQKSIYFLPSCEPHEPKGITGGENFGILAEIPVLVN
jgi:hypothetical protein